LFADEANAWKLAPLSFACNINYQTDFDKNIVIDERRELVAKKLQSF